MELCNSADQIDLYDEVNLTCKGFLNLLQAERAEHASENEKEALANFNVALQTNPDCVPALIGKDRCTFLLSSSPRSSCDHLSPPAQRVHLIFRFTPRLPISIFCQGRASVEFSRKEFRAALGTYRNILKLKPTDCPASVRVGIGMCLARLKQTSQVGFALLDTTGPPHPRMAIC